MKCRKFLAELNHIGIHPSTHTGRGGGTNFTKGSSRKNKKNVEFSNWVIGPTSSVPPPLSARYALNIRWFCRELAYYGIKMWKYYWILLYHTLFRNKRFVLDEMTRSKIRISYTWICLHFLFHSILFFAIMDALIFVDID